MDNPADGRTMHNDGRPGEWRRREVLAAGAGLIGGMAAVALRRAGAQEKADPGVFARSNLVAWCIVPFDIRKRGPEERAAMLKRLGLRRLAYDWRNEHVPTFEAEILALKAQGIEFFAFWDAHEAMFSLFEKHGLAPQIWKTAPSPGGATEEQKVEAAAKSLGPIVERTRRLKCRLGLYNHGGWGGEPSSLVAVCERLRKDEPGDRIGIVYNFHHGHGHIGDFADVFARMRPYLHCVNLNGMSPDAKPKIQAVGEGRHEKDMLRVVRGSGYRGALGILCHREDADAEVALRQNIDGLRAWLQEIGDTAALETYRS